MKLLVTGGAGFIGSALCRFAVRERGWSVVNVDKLTYAASEAATAMLAEDPRYDFIHGDICDRSVLDAAFAAHQPDAVAHLAAESHVDRSIDGPEAFVETNVVGTFRLLQAARAYAEGRGEAFAARFRFLHVSTDEVYGSAATDAFFTESDPYAPNSPYAASKAASDHFARAWRRTFGLNVITTNCGNNYGPFQFPEKLIPLMIIRALAGKPLPVYGDGANVRDWIHVEDHAAALCAALERGEPGATYLIGARQPRRNIDVVDAICAALDEARPKSAPYAEQIAYVDDRPGHDRRYAIDPGRAERALDWSAALGFEDGIAKTVAWYLENEGWWRAILEKNDAVARIGKAKTQNAT